MDDSFSFKRLRHGFIVHPNDEAGVMTDGAGAVGAEANARPRVARRKVSCLPSTCRGGDVINVSQAESSYVIKRR